MVIKEAMRDIDEKCGKYGETCFAEEGIYCCEGLICVVHPIWPPVPGWCVGPIPQIKELTEQPLRAHKGQSRFPKYGAYMLRGLAF